MLYGTHPHEDHIGGLDQVINQFEIGTIYMPKIQTNTKTFEDVLDAIEEKGLMVTTPKEGEIFLLEEVTCEIQCAEVEKAKQKNNLNLSSIVIRMTYKEQSYLFMGDAEAENEKAKNWKQTNVIKIGHHGSSTSSSESFLKQVQPQVAVISVGKGNSYGHPSGTILKRLQKNNIVIYRTDEQGNIVILSDGIENKIRIQQEFTKNSQKRN